MKRMLNQLGFEAALKESGLPQPGSNRGYRPEQLVVQFMLSVWCGANRFEHGEVTRQDPVLQRLFGFQRMANFKAAMRLFRKFSQALNERVLGSLYGWLFRQLAVEEVTLDLDSTVMTRYGAQQGACLGYNPAKPGRLSAPSGLCSQYADDGQLLAASRQRAHGPQCSRVSGEHALEALWQAGAAPACPTAVFLRVRFSLHWKQADALHRRTTVKSTAAAGAGFATELMDAR
jgi:hypothetical protein